MQSHPTITLNKIFLTLIGLSFFYSSFLYSQTDREIADSNRVFDWAERNFSELFSPAGVRTLSIDNFVARFYSDTNTWIGINNGSVFVFGEQFEQITPEGSTLKKIGETEIFLSLAAQELNATRTGNAQSNPFLAAADLNQLIREGSPVRRINRLNRPRKNLNDQRERQDIIQAESIRSIDGSSNNLDFSNIGAAGSQLKRLVASDYADGLSALAGPQRPSPRLISNLISAQSDSRPNELNASDMLWQWGQFLDHDIDLTDGSTPPEPANIEVPLGDSFFDPSGTGIATISMNRSVYDPNEEETSPRQQINEITSWIDASNVYGSDRERSNSLRTLTGDGKMKVSAGNLLPFNVDGFPNAGGESASLYFAGDVRANEQLGLTAMHTLFVREHNRLADEIANSNPNLSGEDVFQAARQIVGAQMQVITYREYLPALLGRGSLTRYKGYDDSIDPTISNLFSSAAYRYGHSALSPTLLRLDKNGDETLDGHIALRDAFFAPMKIAEEGGIDPLLRGLSQQVCQTIDPLVIDDVRNFLFGPPGSGGFDLVSLNIQRGRDHGLPSYNATRIALGLLPKTSFADINSDLEIQQRLSDSYENVEQVDLWVGGLAEEKLSDALVGELLFTVIKQQFEALRDGDRFWYSRALERRLVNQVENTSLADIIRRNTDIGAEIDNDVFHVN
ncbi:MAG: peroxidase family protein [Pseudohongiellaceae bacterium]